MDSMRWCVIVAVGTIIGVGLLVGAYHLGANSITYVLSVASSFELLSLIETALDRHSPAAVRRPS